MTEPEELEASARRSLLLGRAALQRGRVDAAADLARTVLALDLASAVAHDGQRRHRLHSQALVLAVDADLARGEVEGAVRRAEVAWRGDPVDPFVVGARHRALVVRDGPDGAIRALGLERVRPVDPVPAVDIEGGGAGVVAMAICRDERSQLPSFLAHHRAIGVRRFVIVDDGSVDGSLELLADQPDVDLWRTSVGFRDLAFGAAAFSAIAHRHLVDRWLLLVDLDERFVPPPPTSDLPGLVAMLDDAGCDALRAVLVDLCDDRPLASPRSEVPLDLVGGTFLDRRWSHAVLPGAGPFGNADHHVGGLRGRAFGDPSAFLLAKVPLVRHVPGRLLVGGQHDTDVAPGRVATGRAAVLHTKLLGDPGRWLVEADRAEHANGAADYARYAQRLATDPTSSLVDPEASVAYAGPEQLVALGIVVPVGPARHSAPTEVAP